MMEILNGANKVREAIGKLRQSLGLEEEGFGERFGISADAVRRFERGVLLPSYDLWMRLAEDAGIGRNEAVVMWARMKVPKEDRGRIVAAEGEQS